jgi:hypothetical protein
VLLLLVVVVVVALVLVLVFVLVLVLPLKRFFSVLFAPGRTGDAQGCERRFDVHMHPYTCAYVEAYIYI